MKRKSNYVLGRTLALALALLLTLGNLPLISFAEGEPQGPKELDAQFFFVTGQITNPNDHTGYQYGGFWPSWSNPIRGTIYSTTDLVFTHDVIGNPHYNPNDPLFAGVEFQVKNDDKEYITEKFTADQLDTSEIKDALLSQINRVSPKEPFVMIDKNQNKVILKPEELKNDGFSIKLFRFANQIKVHKKLHLDIYVERPAAKPIHVIEKYEDDTQISETYNEKYGTVLDKPKSHKIKTIQIKYNETDQYQPHDPNIPVLFDNQEKWVIIEYVKRMSGGIEVLPIDVGGKNIESSDEQIFKDLISFKENESFVPKTMVGSKHIVEWEEIKIGAPEGFEVEKVLYTMMVNGKEQKREIKPTNGIYKVKHEEDIKVVLKVSYKTVAVETHTKLNAYIIKDDGTPESLPGEFTAEIGKDYSLEDIIKVANLAGYEFKSVKLNDPSTEEMIENNTIPADKVTKDLKNVYLYFVKKPVLKVGKVTIQYKEGANDIDASLLTGAPTELSGNVGEEKTFKTPVIKGYSLNSVSVDGTVLSPGNDGDYSVTLKDTPQTVVVDYKKLNQLSPGITLILNNGEDTPTETELPQANIGDKYEVKVPDYFDVVSITILEEGSTQPTVIEASGLTSDQLQEYLKLEYKNVKQTVTVVYQRKTSDIKVIEYLNDTEIATKNEKAPFGKDYTIPINSNYNLIKVDLAWDTDGIPDFKFPEFEPVEEKYEIKIYYKNKDNGGNNNNNNNNDNGGNNNNNDNANSGDTDNRDRYEYQEYNPDKENVIIKDDKAPLGQLNTDSYYAYIQGYPDGSVKPGAYVSRQETAAIFFRLLNPSYRETIRTDENSFSDVDKNTWSNKHISTLAKGGIIVGYEDGTFKPKQIITRAELISIASKFDKLDGNANHNFKDIAGHWAEKQIAAAAQKGTISGYLNGEFAPDKPVTRAEFAKIVNKVLNRSVKKAEVLPGVKQFTDLQSDMWYYEDMVTATNSYNATRGDDGYQKWTELIKIFIEM